MAAKKKAPIKKKVATKKKVDTTKYMDFPPAKRAKLVGSPALDEAKVTTAIGKMGDGARAGAKAGKKKPKKVVPPNLAKIRAKRKKASKK